MKPTKLIACLSAGLISSCFAADYIVTNVNQGVGDTLYANASNVLLNGGIVTVGYFTQGFTVGSSLTDVPTLLANYTEVASGIPGSHTPTLDGLFPGYVERPLVDGATILAGNPLINRALYSFIGTGTTLANSLQYALVPVGTLKQDGPPTDFKYLADPAGRVPLIGTLGTYSGDAGAGNGTYNTLKTMVVVPEPSAALLGTLGVLGLLRRRRI